MTEKVSERQAVLARQAMIFSLIARICRALGVEWGDEQTDGETTTLPSLNSLLSLQMQTGYELSINGGYWDCTEPQEHVFGQIEIFARDGLWMILRPTTNTWWLRPNSNPGRKSVIEQLIEQTISKNGWLATELQMGQALEIIELYVNNAMKNPKSTEDE
ncbi:TPA: hypothetical protein DEP96_00355 [Candidatus Uhrbacteria bacterium]|nr:hypothetical protein [Candidatus Uhrbacteria bacterium]